MTAWDVIQQIRGSKDKDLKGGFFEDLPSEGVVPRPDGGDIGSDRPGVDPEYYQYGPYEFPRTVWPRNLKVSDFPAINYGRIDGRVRDGGMHVLAWYRSFHWERPESWGIYIPADSIWYLAQKFHRGSGGTGGPLEYVQAAYDLIIRHEFFHYIVDMGATVLESAASFGKKFYTPYVRSRNIYDEEALANAWALRKRYKPSGVVRVIREFMQSQPQGYRDFDGFAGKKFTEGLRGLGNMISGNELNMSIPIEGIFNLHETFDHSRIPVHILETKDIPKASQYFLALGYPRYNMEEIEESPKFTKQVKKQSRGNPRIKKDIESAKMKLVDEQYHRSLDWKSLGGKKDFYQFRINQKCRIHCSPAGIKKLILEKLMCHH